MEETIRFREQKHSKIDSISPTKQSLSSRFWGIDWTEALPVSMAGGKITVQNCNYSDIQAFLSESSSRVDGPELARLKLQSEERTLFYSHYSDLISFQAEGKTVGVFIANASDWSTYYIRYAAILPEWRGHSLYRDMLLLITRLVEDLSVERIEMDVSPSNTRNIQIITDLGFVIAGTWMSDRWGGLLRCVKYLNQDSGNQFISRFCNGGETPVVAKSVTNSIKKGAKP